MPPSELATWHEGGPEPTPPRPQGRWYPRQAHLRRSSSGDSEYARSDRGELYARILQDLLQALDLPATLFYLCLALAGEISQFPNLFGWHEARPNQPVLKELADPSSVFYVSLPAGDILQIPGVQKPTLKQTPVASIPTSVTPKEASQFLSCSSPRVVAANSWISWWSSPAAR